MNTEPRPTKEGTVYSGEISDEDKARFRALIAPVVLEMNRQGWSTLTLKLNDGILNITAMRPSERKT